MVILELESNDRLITPPAPKHFVNDRLGDENRGPFLNGALGSTVHLKPGWHDFRNVLKELAREHGAVRPGYYLGEFYVEESFRTSFSRAVRSLVKARQIQFPPRVPIVRPADKDGIRSCLLTQRRFGSLKSPEL